MIKSFRYNLGIITIIILAIIPILMWLFISPLSVRVSSPSTIFRSLGQLTGLLGMTLLSINFILAARFRFLDKLFNGLNRVYLKHHLIGGISFCLLLFHPTFLVIQYLFLSLKSSLLFILSTDNWALNFGKLGLVVFVVLMVITFYLHFKYENWKNTHKYLGIVLLLGGIHMLWIPSDISNNDHLKYYMLVLVVLGIFSYFYRTIFAVYKKKEYKYKIEKVIKVNENVAELVLSPVDRKIRFLPGQFIFLRFEKNGTLSESHPFSITSSLGENNLSLGIKTLGDYTSMVYLLKPGVTCLVEGPFGAFSYLKAKSKKQIWVAGGIGITPFLSMARQIDAEKNNNKGYDIDLYYSLKNNTEKAFTDEFMRISQRNANFKFHQSFSSISGYLSADLILKNNKNAFDNEIFLCGPPSFMKNLRKQFIEFGFKNSKVHSEEFSL